MKIAYISISVVLSLFLYGCGNSNSSEVDRSLRTLINDHNLTGDPSTGRVIPSVDDPKVELGKKLFFTKSLGGNLDAACVTCHHPNLGGGDNLVLPIGTEAVEPDLLGPGRQHKPSGTDYDAGPTVPRNAPSTYNVVLFDAVMFWDGRVESVTHEAGKNGSGGGIMTPDSNRTADPKAGANLPVAQARFPETSPQEMRGFTFEAGNSNEAVRQHLAARMAGTVDVGSLPKYEWLPEFQKGYQTTETNVSKLITPENIVDAIGEYERSQLFINNPWKAYVEGDTNAISEEAKKGAKLFFTSYENGGANCVLCHSGDVFTDEGFHVLGVPQIGRGKGDGPNGDDDFGRYRVTHDPEDMYRFRTPTLLNVEVTGPWGHSGAYTTLEGMVRHMSDPLNEAIGYDESQLKGELPSTQLIHRDENTYNALLQLAKNRQNGLSEHQDTHLTDEEVDQIVAFLKTLTDPCIKDESCIGQWNIEGNVSDSEDPDGLLLRAVDQTGSYL